MKTRVVAPNLCTAELQQCREPHRPQGAVPWVAWLPPDYANLRGRKHLEREESQKGALISQGKPAGSLTVLPQIYSGPFETCLLPCFI